MRDLRWPLRFVGVCALAWVSIAAPAVVVDSGQSRPPPSVLLVLFDDADTESFEHLPNIMRLVADRGAAFERFYVTEPLCCPSRASLLLGEYPHNHGIIDNYPPLGGFPVFRDVGHEERTIAGVMKRHGYRTGYFGKYMNRYGPEPDAVRHVPPHWDRWVSNVETKRYGYVLSDQGAIRRPEGYVDTVIMDAATEWISSTAEHDDPFFAVVAPVAPHPTFEDQDDPPPYREAFADLRHPAADKPSFGRVGTNAPSHMRERTRASAADREAARERFVHRLRQMRHVDDYVGEIVDGLAGTGRLANTYVFVTSDNGWMQGEHRILGGKTFPYEESVKVPLLVRGPWIPAGTAIGELTSMVDLYPTFADVAGTSARRDGRSLLGLLEGRETSWRTRLLVENQSDKTYIVPRYTALVTERIKYISYENGEREVFDLETDPFEMRNIESSRAPDELDGLQRYMHRLQHCRGASCRVADSPTALPHARP